MRWIAENRRSKESIGRIELFRLSMPDRDALQVACLFAPRYWRRGYATEALLAVVDFAFTKLERDHVAAITRRANHRSLRLLERCGFSRSNETAPDSAGVGCEVWWTRRLSGADQP
jgi:[ribosomal protein S5]-alanine N-acetyltransferase